MNKRIFVKKRDGFEVESESLAKELKTDLALNDDFKLTKYNIYDIFNADEADIDLLKAKVLAEAVTDEVLEDVDLSGKEYLAYEFLPGQYDQRADSAVQCLMLLSENEGVKIRSGSLLVFENVDPEKLDKIADYMINPVEARKKDLSVLKQEQYEAPKPVAIMEGFIELDEEGLKKLHESMGLAMSLKDLAFIQEYFKNDEKRDPTLAEIRVLDTYWSDHCRHTTFETKLNSIKVDENTPLKDAIEEALKNYLALHDEFYKNKPRDYTLMDMATIAGKELRKEGKLNDLEESEEINACSIEVDVDVNGESERWLLMFKNETHNHPTEIEPFGGASTCIGGAIRDPLSGRAYVYQAMRITGAGDITAPIEKTLKNKLPQSKISKKAAQGYSSYGNQIGLATTFVEEIFDEGYMAKRMEVGGVVGAAPKANVKRERPEPGDIIVLIGGATGRDGIGGATGSSKEHDDSSLHECSSEVQKGNALIERKLQRLFRNPEATILIKRSNDFGAGGVSVAVGELADGLDINLDVVPVKYEGLDGTELAISESQERMAVCIAEKDLDKFLEECHKENLSGVVVAKVTDTNRMVMDFKGQRVVDLSRDFINTNGVRAEQDVEIAPNEYHVDPFAAKANTLEEVLQLDQVSSQIGLAEMFDASIGKSTVLMPFGGKRQLTPEEGSVQKLPVDGFTNTCSLMTYGYDPALSKYSPYLGASYSVVEALARLAALGAEPLKARLSNQEYFERVGSDPKKWGQPVQALLGLIEAEMAFETPAIGGKDSMSGTFNDIHVPPTLITFAVTTADTKDIVSSALKETDSHLYLLKHNPKEDGRPDYEGLKDNFKKLHDLQQEGRILAAKTVKAGGVGAALAKMAFGNGIGFEVKVDDPYGFNIGSIVVEAKEPIDDEAFIYLGRTNEGEALQINDEILAMEDAIDLWEKRYSKIYPQFVNADNTAACSIETTKAKPVYSKVKVEKPVVVIPIFPGQNCEYDTTAKFERAGGEVHQVVFNNLNVKEIEKSIDRLAKEIENGQILMIVGGFSSGDEPDGSGKFIADVLSNEKIAKAIDTLRANDGLILGICNGFQALIKSGLLPYGDVASVTSESPTLFRNDINRHVSHMATTAIASNKSPWLASFKPGDTHTIAVSHGEGKFVASPEVLEQLIKNGQVATQYVDEDGVPTMNGKYNINGSTMAIEGILSEDGKIFGKMGHSERYESGLFQNISGNLDQNIFENGIRYFKHS